MRDYDRRGGAPGGWARGPPMGGPGPRGGGYGGPPGGGPPFRGGYGGGPPPDRTGGPPPAAQLPPPISVDREKTCPLLLRVWCKRGGHNRLEAYAKRGSEPEGELQIYTWPDARLRELADLISDVTPEAQAARVRLSFAFVYPNSRGVNVMKEVGQVWADGRRRTPDDAKSLQQLSHQTGDFLDVAIL